MNLTYGTKQKDIRREWHLVDVSGKILGRVSSEISQLLMGKSKPYFVSYLDCGDYVVIINAKKVAVSGKKQTQKIYMRYSGYPSGLKKKTFENVLKEDPERIVREAVSGMLPNNKLRASMLKRLFIFADENHTYKNKLKIKN